MRSLTGIFLLITACLALLAVWTRTNQPTRYWPGWYVARFPGEIDGVLLHDALESEGIFDALSAWSARVLFQEIPRTAEIPVADIDRRMEPGDPRLDPFLRNIGRLFRSEDRAVVYLPADRSVSAYRRILRSHPVLFRAEIMDEDSRSIAQSTLAFFVAAVLIWLLTADGAAELALVALPWLAVVALGGAEVLLPALASYGIVTLRHSRPRNALWCWSAAAAIIVFAVLYFTSAATAMFLFAFASSEVVPGLLKSRGLARGEKYLKSIRSLSRRREHVLFEPLTLAPPNRGKAKTFAGPFHIWKPGAVGCIVFLSAFYPEPEDHDPIPAGGTVIASFDSMSGLHRLSGGRRTSDRLPDLSDLVSSTAYQEGFMNGARYSLPVPGDSLIRREYRGLETALVVEEKAVTTYNEAWFIETVNRSLRRGAGQLYASLGGVAPVRVVTRPESLVIGKSLDFTAYALIVLAMMLAVLPGFVLQRNDAVSGRPHPYLSTLPRRAQAA